jgi:hypothetical protein
MQNETIIRDESGAILKARVEVGDGFIVLHSRSGRDRNRDYRPALELILGRLDRANLSYDIYLDSQPAQSLPKSDRRLECPPRGPVSERFNQLIREMNAGGASHGAYKRIRLEVRDCNGRAISTLLRGEGPKPQRLGADQLRKVTPSHIDEAVARLLAGEEFPQFGTSTGYDLITPEGSRLPPKKVFGLALESALGFDIQPGHFTAGHGHPAFQLLEAAGYPVVAKSESDLGAQAAYADIALAEGSPKLNLHLQKERKPALAKAKKRSMLQALGRLVCERCRLDTSTLGPHGDAVIEVHHAVKAISEMEQGHITRLSDLQCLCANCHRIVHREISAENAR